MYFFLFRRRGRLVPAGTIFGGKRHKKILYIVTLYSNCTRALTVQDLLQPTICGEKKKVLYIVTVFYTRALTVEDSCCSLQICGNKKKSKKKVLYVLSLYDR